MGSSKSEARFGRVHRNSSCQTIGKRNFLHLMLVSSLVFGASFPVSAQTLDDFLQRQLFDFEQCANACQIELDQQVFSCGPFREDKSRAMPKDCFENNYDRHKRCTNACPADPRKQP
jgi:hypothetical protein